MEENVIQTNYAITINVDVSVKNIMHGKNTIFGILLHVALNIVNIQQELLTI